MSMPRALALLAALGLAGCATFSTGSGSGPRSYADNAKENYELGEKALADNDWVTAARYLEFTSAKFPYSEYSPLAELALGDLNFDQEKFVEAVERYRNFIKMHPSHAKADYAAFRIAEAYYAQIPSDFFLLPSSAEKDQTDELDALHAYDTFLIQYPSSELRPAAQKKVTELRHRLADHEMRIAQFYLDHQRPLAAVGRYEGVLQQYAGAGYDGDAALKLYRTYAALKEPDKAKATLKRFLEKHPDDPKANEARKLLQKG